jgi:exonuclease V gamma subunit
VLAARERIYFSYIDRDAKAGDPLEPSSVIRELQFMLRGFVDRDALAKLTLKHPVSRYDLQYFPEFAHDAASDGDLDFSSFDPDARRGARMIALRQKIDAADNDQADRESLLDRLDDKSRDRLRKELQFVEFEKQSKAEPQAATEEIALPIAAIRKYLECPLQGATRYSLGMLADEEPPDEEEDEPVEQSRFDRTVMLRKVFWRAGDKLDALAKEYAREVRIAQAHGQASAGQFAQAAAEADLAALHRWIAQASEAGVGDFEKWKDIQIGRADEFADAGEILPPIALSANVRHHDGSIVTPRVSLYGTIRGASTAAGVAINCVTHKKIKSKDFLPPFINAIVFAAAGVDFPERFRAIVIGTESTNPESWIREFQPMDRNSALAYLSTLVSDLLSTDNNYFLPIEAVEKVANELKLEREHRDLVDAVEQILLLDTVTCASEYGPMRNARDFDPPDEDTIEQIVARRFAPLIGIFKRAVR